MASVQDLDKPTRLLLVRFVCLMAWTDFELHPKERERVLDLVERLGLSEEDQRRVDEWLQTSPSPDEVDPQSIPRDSRDLFMAELHAMVEADGVIHEEEELSTLKLLRKILGYEPDDGDPQDP